MVQPDLDLTRRARQKSTECCGTRNKTESGGKLASSSFIRVYRGGCISNSNSPLKPRCFHILPCLLSSVPNYSWWPLQLFLMKVQKVWVDLVDIPPCSRIHSVVEKLWRNLHRLMPIQRILEYAQITQKYFTCTLKTKQLQSDSNSWLSITSF